MNLDGAIKQLRAYTDACEVTMRLWESNDTDAHFEAYNRQDELFTELDLPAILAAMEQAKARLESAEKVVEAAKVLASKAERKKGTTAQWIVWNSELTPLDEALAQHESKDAK